MGIYMLLPVIAGMGAVAGLAVVAVLVGRCFLKRGPKLFCYLLWSVVLFRLLCPVSVPSMFSALRLFGFKEMEFAPSKPTAFPALLKLQAALGRQGGLQEEEENIVKSETLPENKPQGGEAPSGDMDFFDPFWAYMDVRASGGAYDLWLAWQGRFDAIRQPGAKQTAVPEAMETGRAGQYAPAGVDEPSAEGSLAGQAQVPLWLVLLTWVWLSGIVLMLLYSLFGLLRLRRRLVGAVRVRGNIYRSDYIATAFVFGLFSPRIYLPSVLCGKEQEFILLHEQTHIRRGDYIFRLLAFAALMLHWFNPLVWLAFYLSGKDMEMACDEAVMKRMKEDIRAEYSASLLGLATGRHFVPGTYLAFGEGDVKGRIQNIMRYKKPTVFWMVFAAILVSGTVCAFGSDPKTQGEARHTGNLEGILIAGSDIYRNKKEAKQGEMAGEADADGKASHTQAKSQGGSAGKPEDESAVLTVYSLSDSTLARELVGGFALLHPEIKVCHETGEDGLSVTEQADALSARLLAGTGPDVLLLDGLPAQVYQENGLLTDMAKTLEPMREQLQPNILSAYTGEGKVFMLPVRYCVPLVLMEGQDTKTMESLRSLAEYAGRAENGGKVWLEGYSWADLLELAYYNYTPQVILPDGTIAQDIVRDFLLYTKRLGDAMSIEGEAVAHRYFSGKLSAESLKEKDGGLLFLPFGGADDLYAYSAQMEEIMMQGRKIQQVGGVFFPEGLIGINAWSSNKELAALFVQAVFSAAVQEEFADTGFCVNAQVFQKGIEDWAAAWEEQTHGKAWRKQDANGKGDFTWNTTSLAGQTETVLCQVHTGQSVDAAVLQILTEEAMGYFRGEVSLEECVEAVVERLW